MCWWKFISLVPGVNSLGDRLLIEMLTSLDVRVFLTSEGSIKSSNKRVSVCDTTVPVGAFPVAYELQQLQNTTDL